MKSSVILQRVFTGNYLVFFFYLFMTICGFVAGTQIWSQNNGISLGNIAALINMPFSGILTTLLLPPTLILVLSSVIALFAGGWILLPFIIYSAGTVGGYVLCGFFSNNVISANTGILFAFAVSYFCCFAIIAYECVYSHTLSRTLSCGGICRAAYKRFAKSTVISFCLIIITAFVFSLLIYCLFSFVK